MMLRGQQDGGAGGNFQMAGVPWGVLRGPVSVGGSGRGSSPALAREQPAGMGNEGRGAVRWGQQGRVRGWG